MPRYIVYDPEKGVFLGIIDGVLRWSSDVLPDMPPELRRAVSFAQTFESWEQMDDFYAGQYGKDDFPDMAELRCVTPTIASPEDCEAVL